MDSSSPYTSDSELDELTSPNYRTATSDVHRVAQPVTSEPNARGLDGPPLSFPTPSPSSAHYFRTPPAALSSRGPEYMMSVHMSSSTTSLSDGVYDMVDDASELSGDDRETASLISEDPSGSDLGELTPDDASLVDVEEQRPVVMEDGGEEEHCPVESLDTVQPTTSFETATSNSLVESYLNEDMETPRQSTVHSIKSLTTHTIEQRTPSTTGAGGRKTYRVLLAYDGYIREQTPADIAQRLAICLSFDESPINSLDFEMEQVRLTSSWMDRTTILRYRDVELIVQPCGTPLGLPSSPASIKLDVEMPSVAQNGRLLIESRLPDLVYFHITHTEYPYWFDNIKKDLLPHKVPMIAVTGTSADFLLSPAQKSSIKQGCGLSYTTETFLEGNDTRQEVQQLVLLPQSQSLPPKANPSPATKSTEAANAKTSLGCLFSRNTLITLLVTLFLSFCLQNLLLPHSSSVNVDTLLRGESLATAWTQFTNTTDALSRLNRDHLVPRRESLLGEYGGYTSTIRSQGVLPNHILLSLPRKPSSRKYLQPSTVTVHRAAQPLESNMTQLIDGIYAITLEPAQAYGAISANVIVKKAGMNITVSSDFGNNLVQRTTTDLAKTITKDVAVARQRIKSLADLLSLELTAGAAATKNLTSELSIYIARDMQVFVNTFSSVMGKAMNASHNWTAQAKAIMVRDSRTALSNIAGAVEASRRRFRSSEKYTKPLRGSGKKALRTSLIAGRKKALGLKNWLTGQKAEANRSSSSATKELSLRFQSLFKPTHKTKLAGTLQQIAQCVAAKDYFSCRREQRKAAQGAVIEKKNADAKKLPASASPVRTKSASVAKKESTEDEKVERVRRFLGARARSVGAQQMEKRAGKLQEKAQKRAEKVAKKMAKRKGVR